MNLYIHKKAKFIYESFYNRYFLLIQYHNYLLLQVRKDKEAVIRWIKLGRDWTIDKCLCFRLTVQQWISISCVLCVYVTYWLKVLKSNLYSFSLHIYFKVSITVEVSFLIWFIFTNKKNSHHVYFICLKK